MDSISRSTSPPDVVQVVQSHPHRGQLATLCIEVVRCQAEAHSSRAGRFVRARIRKMPELRRRAETDLGDVTRILERGPQRRVEAELIMALALDALGDELQGEGGAEVAREFVELAGWLSSSTPYDPYTHAPSLLSPVAGQRLAEALEAALDASSETDRAVSWSRLEALVALDPGMTRLTRLSARLADVPLAAAARALCGAHEALAPNPVLSVGVEGVWEPALGAGLWRVVAWLTGYALLRRVALGAAWLVGFRRHAELWIDGAVVRVERTTGLLNWRVHVIEESLRAEDVTMVVRELRRPVWIALLGAFSTLAGSLGFLVGAHLAVSFGSWVPMAFALAVLGLGAGLDLLLDFYLKSRGPSAWLEIAGGGRTRFRIAQVDPIAARQVVLALEEVCAPAAPQRMEASARSDDGSATPGGDSSASSAASSRAPQEALEGSEGASMERSERSSRLQPSTVSGDA